MNWRHYLLLAVLGLAVTLLVATFQPAPGYMDADYYYAGGLQLANGHGFTEPYLWNYLDDPIGLPHPSHSYWMPLASLLAAAGAFLFGSGSWAAARIGFVAVAALIPPVTGALAWSLTFRRDFALTSGLLAVFSAFYLPFLTTTDTFGLYMLLGGLFFLFINRKFSIINSFLLGILAGFMHLTRADGLLWLLIAFLAILFTVPKPAHRPVLITFYGILFTFSGYLLIMAPWFARNLSVFGSLLAPGGSKMLWLTSYDQIFSYPASQINLTSWWHSGLAAILKVRLWALGLNLANMLSVQGEVFLLPLIFVGLRHFRKDRRVQLAGLAWLLLLAAMTIVFPLAGARGGFFHSGSALQPIWWALAPVGLDRVIQWVKQKRGWSASQAGLIFRPMLVVLAALLTVVIVWSRVLGGGGGQAPRLSPGYIWGQEKYAYTQINQLLIQRGMLDGDVVIVANPPGFYLASGHPAIALPGGDELMVVDVARRYGAKYLILESGSMPNALMNVFENPDNSPNLTYLGEVNGALVFAVKK